jgi:hypothetical protein
VSTAPKWVRRVQAKLARQPEITALVCGRCGRSMYRSDWDEREGCCLDCSTEQGRAFEMSDNPFLPEDEEMSAQTAEYKIRMEVWQEAKGAVTLWIVESHGHTLRKFKTLEAAEQFVAKAEGR